MEGYHISMIIPPAGTMGELPDAPPVIYPDNGVLHMYKLAEGQEKDPIISWFMEYICDPTGWPRRPRQSKRESRHAS